VTAEAPETTLPSTPTDPPAHAGVGRRIAPFLAPAGAMALVTWLGFNAGGFFPGTVGYAAIAAGLVLLVWLTTADRPFGAAVNTVYHCYPPVSASHYGASRRAKYACCTAICQRRPPSPNRRFQSINNCLHGAADQENLA